MTHIPGVTIEMGGREFIVPPLTLGQLRRLLPKVRQMTEVGASMGEEQIETLCEIVAAAMRRNYPEITEDAVADLLDLGNASGVLSAVLTGSGLRTAQPGEALAGRSNGIASMEFSPASADTPTP